MKQVLRKGTQIKAPFYVDRRGEKRDSRDADGTTKRLYHVTGAVSHLTQGATRELLQQRICAHHTSPIFLTTRCRFLMYYFI